MGEREWDRILGGHVWGQDAAGKGRSNLIWFLYSQIPLSTEGHWVHPGILIPQDSEAFVQQKESPYTQCRIGTFFPLGG